MSEFGQQLRAAREERSWSLEELARRTRINRRHLESIEAGRFDELPEGPYAKAFVREFARAVGLTVPQDFAEEVAQAPQDSKAPKVVSRPIRPGSRSSVAEGVIPIANVAKGTARIANSAVRNVAKTTEKVVGLVESGSKEALEVLTSKTLWEEAAQVRRERQGLPPVAPAAGTPQFRVHPTPDVNAKPAASTSEEASSSREAAIPDVVSNTIPPTTPVASDVSVAVPSDEHVLQSVPLEPEPLPESYEYAETEELPKSGGRATTNIVIVLLILLFGGAVYYAATTYKHQSGPVAVKDYVPAPIERPKSQPHPRQQEAITPSAPAVTEAPVAAVAQDSLTLKMRATAPVWISIAPDGVPAYRGELKAGESLAWKASSKFVVDVGNQKSVAMTFNGQPLSGLPTIPNSGVVVRNLVLTRDKATVGAASIPLGNRPVSVPTPTMVKPAGATPSAVKPAVHPSSSLNRSSAQRSNVGDAKPSPAAPHTSTIKHPSTARQKFMQAHPPANHRAFKAEPMKRVPEKSTVKRRVSTHRRTSTPHLPPIPSVDAVPATP